MDRFEGTSNIIKAYYQFKRNGNNAEFVSKVCEYFNCIKSDKGALLYLPIRKVMCALILFRELRDKSRSRLYLAQTRSAIHTLRQSRYFLFFLPRPFPLADLNAVE